MFLYSYYWKIRDNSGIRAFLSWMFSPVIFPWLPIPKCKIELADGIDLGIGLGIGLVSLFSRLNGGDRGNVSGMSLYTDP